MHNSALTRWSARTPKCVRAAPAVLTATLCVGLFAALWPFYGISSGTLMLWALLIVLLLGLYFKKLKNNQSTADELIRTGLGQWQLAHVNGAINSCVPSRAWFAGFCITVQFLDSTNGVTYTVTIWNQKANKQNWRKLNVWLAWEVSLGEQLRKGLNL